jgi:hypothetical protein
MPECEHEEELWRLRSVEYDLESERTHNRSLSTLLEAARVDRQEAVNEARIAKLQADVARQGQDAAERMVKQAQVERDEARAEAEWALTKLAEFEAADHMYQTYDFKVVESKVRRSKGWRLSR